MLASSRMESKYDICDNTWGKGDRLKQVLAKSPSARSVICRDTNKTQNKQIGRGEINLDLVGVGHFFPGSGKCSISERKKREGEKRFSFSRLQS